MDDDDDDEESKADEELDKECEKSTEAEHNKA